MNKNLFLLVNGALAYKKSQNQLRHEGEVSTEVATDANATITTTEGETNNMKLRVCNGYLFLGEDEHVPLHVYKIPHGSSPTKKVSHVGIKLTEKALAYNECTSLSVHLNTGDELRFGGEDFSAGFFEVTDEHISLTEDADMFVMMYRADQAKNGATFVSHVFQHCAVSEPLEKEELCEKEAQIVVFTGYQGEKKTDVRIAHTARLDLTTQDWKCVDDLNTDKDVHWTPLKMNTAHLIEEGNYQIIMGDDCTTMRRIHLSARGHYGLFVNGQDKVEGVTDGVEAEMVFYSNAKLLSGMFAVAMAFVGLF